LMKCPESYQHEDPERVGNRRRFVISELSGRANIIDKARELGVDLGAQGERTQRVLSRIKDLEHRGFQFEGADASTELLIRRTDPRYSAPFELTGFHVLVREQADKGMLSEASVKIAVGAQAIHTAAEGNGPVNALDRAVRKALLPIYPRIGTVKLVDYKVRILDGDAGTAARIRVSITSSNGPTTWTTVGCGTNVIEASWIALSDALEYALIGVEARRLRPVEVE
jgi:2-isopropylmalate synthase